MLEAKEIELQESREVRGRLRDALRVVQEDKGAIVGAIIVLGFVGTSIAVYVSELIGVRITPYAPLQENVGPALGAPSLAHPFGTDILGRDVFSRIVSATPGDFTVGIVVIAFSFLVGALMGSYAAFHGGLVDEALMRVTDIFFAIPALVLAMSIGLALGPGITNMTIALMIIWWPPYARLARGETLKVVHQSYIEAARLSGLGKFAVLLKHVIPNITITMLVYATLDVGTVILIYSGLSYLGLAVRPPRPDWGEMVSSYQDWMISAPWLPLIPGFIIALGVIGFSLLGDGIRDALEVY